MHNLQCKWLLDVNTNSFENFTITQIFARRLLSPWLWPDFIFNILPTAKQFRKCISVVHDIIYKIIDERSVVYQENMNSSKEEQARRMENITLVDTFFDKYFEGKVDKKFMREELENVVFGGTDTMSTTLQWIILLVSSYPDVQKKLQEEIDVFFQENDQINTSNYNKLVYTEGVIKESLRLYSPVPIIGRVAGEDFKIGNYKVKKGTNMSIFLSSLHRDPKHFTNPNDFNPDRFLRQKLAYLQLKIILSGIFQKYNIKSNQKIEEVLPSMEMVLRPSKDIYVTLTHRQLE
eukprot:XP_014782622.1 PREDICTED: cytochrome P450 4C1-like [Octopus bimaculoides]